MFFKAFKLVRAFLLEKSGGKVRGRELIFLLLFSFVLIQMLAKIVLKANVLLLCKILKGRLSSSILQV